VSSSKVKRVGIVLGILLVASGVVLLAFKLTRPPSGHIKVEYGGMSKSGVFIDLENLSTQTIYLVGSGTDVWPGYAKTECKAPDYSTGDSDGYVLSDGYPTKIKVSQGSRVRLSIETKLPRQYKGGHCRVRLELMGGTFVESSVFTPN